jgi:hypothetical protein
MPAELGYLSRHGARRAPAAVAAMKMLASPGHTHAKSAFIYATVLEGAIRSQVNDGPVTTYEVGDLDGRRAGVEQRNFRLRDNRRC